MFQRPILRNEEGGSPGGGAAPVAVAETTEPQAQGEAPVTMSAIRDLIAGLQGEIANQVKNGVHADLRKAGIYDKPKAAAPAAAAPTQPAPTATGNDERMRQRAYDRAVGAADLNDRQVNRMDAAFYTENPADPGEWARNYLDDLGIGKKNAPVSQPATQAPAPVVAAQIQAAPVRTPSDKGPATAGDQRDADSILATRPTELTRYDIDRLNLKHGVAKAQEMVRDAVNLHMRSIRLVPDRRRS